MAWKIARPAACQRRLMVRADRLRELRPRPPGITPDTTTDRRFRDPRRKGFRSGCESHSTPRVEPGRVLVGWLNGIRPVRQPHPRTRWRDRRPHLLAPADNVWPGPAAPGGYSELPVGEFTHIPGVRFAPEGAIQTHRRVLENIAGVLPPLHPRKSPPASSGELLRVRPQGVEQRLVSHSSPSLETIDPARNSWSRSSARRSSHGNAPVVDSSLAGRTFSMNKLAGCCKWMLARLSATTPVRGARDREPGRAGCRTTIPPGLASRPPTRCAAQVPGHRRQFRGGQSQPGPFRVEDNLLEDPRNGSGGITGCPVTGSQTWAVPAAGKP